MPSSGSTTSRIASSTSASNSSSGAVISLIPDLLQGFAGLGQCILKRHPTEQGAFHPGGVLGHSGECYSVTQDILITLDSSARGHHFSKRRDGLQRFADALTDHLLGEHR